MKKVLKPAVIFATTVLFSSSAMSQVSGISSDNLVQYGKEEAYWAAEVTCADESKRVIQRKTDSSAWCGKAVAGFCDKTKEDAAKKICGTQYTSSLGLLEAARQAQNDAALAEDRAKRAERERADQRRLTDQRLQQQRAERQAREAQEQRIAEQQIGEAKKSATPAPLETQISIQEELIQIDQEKLNLRRQELELQRRAAEIEAELNKNT